MNNIIHGDALTVLSNMDAESVDCCVTSPPYWSLRDYGVEGQLGLEPTFEEYIEKLVAIFDQVKRVMKKTGTLWVNLGDTYNTIQAGNKDNFRLGLNTEKARDAKIKYLRPKIDYPIKSLCLIPHRFAIAMLDRGWICRNVIIWFKPSCMPSSAKDRFTVDFEYVFFFTRSKKYYFEQQFEDHSESYSQDPRIERGNFTTKRPDRGFPGSPSRGSGVFPLNPSGRNRRCVWKISSQPYAEAHFACYPRKLIEPMIRAGCPRGGLVLDPFAGSGTTGEEAIAQGKEFIGIEINPEYIKLAERRMAETQIELL